MSSWSAGGEGPPRAFLLEGRGLCQACGPRRHVRWAEALREEPGCLFTSRPAKQPEEPPAAPAPPEEPPLPGAHVPSCSPDARADVKSKAPLPLGALAWGSPTCRPGVWETRLGPESFQTRSTARHPDRSVPHKPSWA